MNISFLNAELGHILILLFCSMSFYIIYRTFFNGTANLKSIPPGPTGLKTSMVLLNGMWQENLHELAEKWAKEYGEIVLCRTVMGNICFLNSVRATKEAFKGKCSESVTNERPRTFFGSFVYFGYKDIFSSGPSDKHWASERKLIHSALKFYGDGVARFESTVQSELERLKDRLLPCTETSDKMVLERRLDIEHLPDGSKEVEMEGFIFYSLLCVFWVLLTSEIPAPNDPIANIVKEYNDLSDNLANPANDEILTAFPFLRFVPGLKYKRTCDEILRLQNEFLEHLFSKKPTDRHPGLPRGIADFLQDEQSKDGNEWLTDERIFSVILNIIGGGIITSQSTLLSIFFLLVRHPNVLSTIQKEIDEKIGQRPPSLSDRRILPYTEAVILETLRYTSIVPLGAPHQCTQDIIIDGLRIPKMSLLVSNVWFFHRDPAVWGDPENFRPERFLDSDGNVLPFDHPFQQSLLPFGTGKRACPGENFALSRLFLYVTNILQRFDLLPPVKHKLPPFSRRFWTEGLVLQAMKYHLIIKQRSHV